MNNHNKQLKAATQLGWFVSKITKPFFNKQGFAQNYIIENWETIVGAHFSKNSLPIKLQIKKIGGYLIIACDGSTATELEYSKEKIIKKINSYYGFSAINKIKFQNLPINSKKNKNQTKLNNDNDILRKKNQYKEINDDSLSPFEKAKLKIQKSIVKKKNDL